MKLCRVTTEINHNDLKDLSNYYIRKAKMVKDNYDKFITVYRKHQLTFYKIIKIMGTAEKSFLEIQESLTLIELNAIAELVDYLEKFDIDFYFEED